MVRMQLRQFGWFAARRRRANRWCEPSRNFRVVNRNLGHASDRINRPMAKDRVPAKGPKAITPTSITGKPALRVSPLFSVHISKNTPPRGRRPTSPWRRNRATPSRAFRLPARAIGPPEHGHRPRRPYSRAGASKEDSYDGNHFIVTCEAVKVRALDT